MFDRIIQMFVKELIQVLRDPRMRGVIFVAPVVQLIVLSYAITTDVTNIRIAVIDRDNTPESRELVSRFAGSPYFNIVAHPASERVAQDMIDHEQIQAFIALQPRFAQTLRAGRTAPMQLVVDGTDSSTTKVILGYANDIVQRYSSQVLMERYARTTGGTLEPERVPLHTRTWYNVNLESRPYYVPGMLALIIGLVTLMLTSMAVVRERELGTLEQLMVTPIKPIELIIGKTAPFACVSFVELGIVLCIAVFWFGIPIQGSVWLLLLAALFYIMSMLGVGLLISTTCHTQQQATMTNIMFFMPAILLSGFMFPIANMPRVIQWVTLVNPMRYFVEIVRCIFLKGSGVALLWPNLLALFVLGAAALALASARFKKTTA
ncbi:MAG: ABC transporter permease [bacterium]|nr:ABC transporter permease [bacterium]